MNTLASKHGGMILKKKDITTFEEAEAYINDTPRFTTKNTIEDTRAFLHRLGDPDREMRFIHVAGTNGKGSVCAFLRSILEEAGYRTAVFTSPHLVCIRERFVVDGEMVSEEAFLEAFLHIYNKLDWDALEEQDEKNLPEKSAGEGLPSGKKAYHPTYFEYLFLIAMLLFWEKKPDFCILETGVGGRLDATNSVFRKEISVITHIGLDHVEYLGDTVGKIAFEKAGIFQKGVPAVYWDTCPEATSVFRERAGELGILAYSVSEKDYSFSNFKRKTIDFCVHTQYYNCIPLSIPTIAAYQMENCALAIRAVEVLDEGRTVTAEQIQAGVRAFSWAGRMEEVLPDTYVDGAHNEDGIRAFLETVAVDGSAGKRSLLFSVVKDKDYGHMAERLKGAGLFGRVVLAPMGGARALDKERLEGLFAGCADCELEVFDNVEEGFAALLEERQPGERIYIAGSLYLAGEIKELLEHDKFRRRIEKIPSQP